MIIARITRAVHSALRRCRLRRGPHDVEAMMDELDREYDRRIPAQSSAPPADPMREQVGGDHYKQFAIQPVEFCQRNRLGFCEANIVKYACRHRAKGGAEDVRKIIHYAELLLRLEYGERSGAQ